MIEAYPLTWPAGWRRTPEAQRAFGRFNSKEQQYRPPAQVGGTGYSYTQTKRVTVFDGIQRIIESLNKMGVDRDDLIISTNVQTRLDGLPRSGAKEPLDPGAAVYWQAAGQSQRCMAIDRYTKVADNLAAIAATLEAMRAIERHGGAEILNRAFTGFAALPEKASTPWKDVLELESDPTMESVDRAFKRLVSIHHPDKGGDPEKFQALVRAREDARRELGTAVCA